VKKLIVVGCGAITDDFHLPAVLRSERLELAALVDRDIGRGEMLKRKYGLAVPVAGDLGEVLDGADGVIVATPNHSHGPIARLALESGCGVLVEKPLTTLASEAYALCELAEREGKVLQTGFFTRFYPVVDLVKKLLAEDFFGRIENFHFEYGTAGGWAPLSGYNLDRKQSGGGVLVVMGTHFLDRMLYWFGEAATFVYADDSYGGVEANCRMRFDFAAGFSGTVYLSKSVALRNRFTMRTEHYDVELGWGDSEKLTLYPRRWPGTRLRMDAGKENPDADYFHDQLEDFGAALRGESRPRVGGWEGARNVALCEELYSRRTQLEEPWAWYRETGAE
jgi:predicted dehydrogenase